MSQPLEHLDERPMGRGLIWTCEDPDGGLWVIAWNPAKSTGQVRALRFPKGRIDYWGDAEDKDQARAEALRIAALIAARKKD